MRVLKFCLSLLFLFHQPFIFYKIFNIELFCIALEYTLLLILLVYSFKNIKIDDCIPLVILLILIFPLQLLLGNFEYKYEFFVRILPLVIFLIIIKNSQIIFIKSSVYFLCINILCNILMFFLFKLEFPVNEISTDTGLFGITVYYLSFAVSTAFFNTGDPFLARLQGWAWEPAAFALSTLPLLFMPIAVWKLLFPRYYKLFIYILSLGVFLTKSIAAYLSILIFLVLKNLRSFIWIILFVLPISLFTIQYSDIITFIDNSSLEVRVDQLNQFFKSINIGILIVGNGYASEDALGLEMGQTSIVTRYIIYFGMVKIFFIILLMYNYLFKIKMLHKTGYISSIIAIFISLISLDISLSNIFIGLLISIIALLHEVYIGDYIKKVSV